MAAFENRAIVRFFSSLLRTYGLPSHKRKKALLKLYLYFSNITGRSSNPTTGKYQRAKRTHTHTIAIRGLRKLPTNLFCHCFHMHPSFQTCLQQINQRRYRFIDEITTTTSIRASAEMLRFISNSPASQKRALRGTVVAFESMR